MTTTDTNRSDSLIAMALSIENDPRAIRRRWRTEDALVDEVHRSERNVGEAITPEHVILAELRTAFKAGHQRRQMIVRSEELRTDIADLRAALMAAKAVIGLNGDRLFDLLEEAAERLGGLDLHFGLTLPDLERVAEETHMALAWRDDQDLAKKKLDGALEILDATEDAFDAVLDAA